ncbi:MAG: peptidylprolyl isomerase [Phycisphaerales bacterium]
MNRSALFARLVGLLFVVALPASARAQLAAERLYYGYGQRVPITVTAPNDAAQSLRLRLYDPRSGQVVAETSCAAGRVDLVGLFPRLWTTDTPRVLYAQLMAGTEPFGAPLVLDPRLTPDTARLVDPGTLEPTHDPARGIPMFDGVRNQASGDGSPARTFSALRVYPERDVELVTTQGTMRFRLRPDVAPNTAFNFRHLVEGGFYHGVVFHRVVNELETGARFVVQVGDPSGTGLGGPGYRIDLEPSTLPHGFGVLSMARSGDPNSAGSQVFICLSRAGTGGLDGSYTSFAELIDGADVLDAIARVPTDASDRPLDPPAIERASLVPAAPFPQRAPSLREQPRIVPGR